MSGPDTVMPVLPGLLVIEQLHRGHHVNVYDVWSEERGCRCVAKTLRPDRPRDEKSVRDLMREGRLLSQLTHPHIVRLYEAVRAPVPVVLLETLSGHTLASLLDEHDCLPVQDVLHLGLHLTSAIGYLHRQGWLHLDLKPSNVIADGGRAKLIDLSIARRPGRRRPGIGTPGYLSPEQALGHPLGPAADVWGIGGLLYEAITGDPAVPDTKSRSSVSSSSRSHERRRTTTGGAVTIVAPGSLPRRRRVPTEVRRLIDACLTLDPAARPTIPEMAATLAAALDSTPVPFADASATAARPDGTSTPAQKPAR